MTSRIRYLKPDFFLDEDLADLPPLQRLFYAGLWVHADRDGRLEDRPERLKVEIMPYEKNFDVEEALAALTQPKRVSGRPYIIRYSVGARKFIQIISWHDHQRPHHTEAQSKIPPPDEKELNSYLTVKSPLDNGSITGRNRDWNGKGNGDGEGKEKRVREKRKTEEKSGGRLPPPQVRSAPPSERRKVSPSGSDFAPPKKDVSSIVRNLSRSLGTPKRSGVDCGGSAFKDMRKKLELSEDPQDE